MFKLMSLMKRQEGMSLDEFGRWAVDEHSQIGRDLPNIRKYMINVRNRPGPHGEEPPYDGVFEMWFDDEAALDAALGSETGIRARDDAMAHASQRVHIRVDENPIVG